MYNEHFGFSESPFEVTPDPRFFFINPCYEEAFATVRYGIDSRKGFIVVTGEAGTGKTTLLKRLVHSHEPNVHTACIFDPHLSFTELLRGTLSDLGMRSCGEDRFTMMERFYDYLVRQLESDQIVVLMIDEAQNLSGELLEEVRLLSNLETDTHKLLQIVLVGQPEFEERLDQPQLLRLKQRVSLRCRLRRLERYEIRSYIDARLKTVHCERPDLFDAESVQRVALYSKGIPRVINLICDNALLNAYVASGRHVSVVEIDAAAHELKLLNEPRAARETPVDGSRRTANARQDLSQSRIHECAPRFPTDDPSRMEFDPVFADIERKPRRGKRSKKSSVPRVGLLLTFFLTAGAVFILTAEQRQISIPGARSYIEKLAVFVREGEPFRPNRPLDVWRQSTNGNDPMEMPALENTPRLTEEPGEVITPDSDRTMEQSERPNVTLNESEKPPTKKSPEITKAKPTTPHPPARAPLDEVRRKQKLESEIYRAIRGRAIKGVDVSVSDDTVYLVGRVASREQILAAVRAALTVPGVKNVQNRIVIDG